MCPVCGIPEISKWEFFFNVSIIGAYKQAEFAENVNSDVPI